MTDLKQQALRMILNIDSELEPLEDSFEPITDHARYTKLKTLLVKAESRYYRRSKSAESPWSLVTRIVQQAAAEAAETVVVEAEVTDQAASAFMSELWKRPYL